MLCLYYISRTLYELYTIIKMKLKLKNFEKIFLKKQSLDKEYIILIQNYEFLSLFVLKILVSVACVICTFDLHPLDLIELQLAYQKISII